MDGHQGRSGREENLGPTGIRSPDRPVRRESLYRLRYPGPLLLLLLLLIIIIIIIIIVQFYLRAGATAPRTSYRNRINNTRYAALERNTILTYLLHGAESFLRS